VNTISFIETFQTFFYMLVNINIKQKQKKNISRRPQELTFGLENISRTTTLYFAFIWKVLPLTNLLLFPS